MSRANLARAVAWAAAAGAFAPAACTDGTTPDCSEAGVCGYSLADAGDAQAPGDAQPPGDASADAAPEGAAPDATAEGSAADAPAE